MTDYKVFLSISHHRISFEYYLKGGGDDLKPVSPGNWPAPLAFMVTPTEVIVGQEAENAANRGVENTFTNYFDLLIQDNIFYTLGNERRNIGKILLDASEPMFRAFYRSVLFNHYGDLHDNRLQMPLTIVCEVDIKDNERVYIKSLFNDSGYHMARVVKYEYYIARYVSESLVKSYTFNKVLVIWSEGDDLCLSLFDSKDAAKPVSKVYPRLGTDPRMDLVKKLIWERVQGQNYFLDYASEEATITKAAAEFLNSSTPLLNGTIQLSDGYPYRYSLLRSDIDAFESDESKALRRAIEEFLKENAQDDKSKVLVILRGVAAGNPYFESNIGRGYSNVVRSDKDLREAVMKLIVNDQLIVNAPIDVLTPPPGPYPPVAHGGNSDVTVTPSGRDKRAYKELESSVRTHIANHRKDAAISEINDFLSLMHSKNIHAFDTHVKDLEASVLNSLSSQTSVIEDKVTEGPVEPSIKDKRTFIMAKHEAKAAFANGDKNKAREIMSRFMADMHSKRVVGFDEEIEAILKEYSHSNKTENKLSGSRNLSSQPTDRTPDKKKSAVEPTPRDMQQWRLIKRVVESRLKKNDTTGALKEVKEFGETMHAKGVVYFDKEIQEIKKKITSSK